MINFFSESIYDRAVVCARLFTDIGRCREWREYPIRPETDEW